MSDSWDFYFSKVNDTLASLFVDVGIRESVPIADRPWLLWVWLQFRAPRDDGLSSSEEFEKLKDIEDALSASIHEALSADLIGRITTAGRREFYFYGPEFTGHDDAVARAMARFPEYEWKSGNELDPEWKHYLNVLYPSPRNWQRIKNRHVIEKLEEHGDPLTKPRSVSHFAWFPSESARREFALAAAEHGFTVTNESTTDEPDENPFSVILERVDRVDWDSINGVTLELFELAKAAGGKYDGWETQVQKDE